MNNTMYNKFKDKFNKVFRPNKVRRQAEEQEAREAQLIAYEAEVARRVSERMRDTRLPQNTIIIHDFDDTLFPTTEYGLQETNYWETELVAMFARVERAAMNLLILASTLGVVKIVTQADMAWVRQTCSNYMPDLYLRSRY